MALAVAAVAPLLAESAAGATTTVKYGPFTMPAATESGPGRFETVRVAVRRPCLSCYVTSFAPNLVYGDGTTADHRTGAMLHHAVFTSQFRRDATCSGQWLGLLGERFFASGDERTSIRFPTGYGYRVGALDSWNLLVDVMNMEPQAKAVYVSVTYTYRAPWESVRAVRPVWLDVDQCGDSRFPIPAGFSDTHYDWRVSVPGRVVTVAGHLHDFGMRIDLTNESRGGALICRSTATMDEMGGDHGLLRAMSLCVGDPLATIATGETLRLHSMYESPTPRTDVMGIMLAYVRPT